MTNVNEATEGKTKHDSSGSALNCLVSELTAWQNIKAIISDKLLMWAILLLHKDSPERIELAVFVSEYLKRSLARRVQNMETIKLTVELTYDDTVIHGDEAEAIRWFEQDILMQKASNELLLLHSNEIGDTIGEIKVLSISR